MAFFSGHGVVRFGSLQNEHYSPVRSIRFSSIPISLHVVPTSTTSGNTWKYGMISPINMFELQLLLSLSRRHTICKFIYECSVFYRHGDNDVTAMFIPLRRHVVGKHYAM